jgi:hypothetical protein
LSEEIQCVRASAVQLLEEAVLFVITRGEDHRRGQADVDSNITRLGYGLPIQAFQLSPSHFRMEV